MKKKNSNGSKGIFTICGLNGVGKSTVFTAIKDILGINDEDKELEKREPDLWYKSE